MEFALAVSKLGHHVYILFYNTNVDSTDNFPFVAVCQQCSYTQKHHSVYNCVCQSARIQYGVIAVLEQYGVIKQKSNTLLKKSNLKINDL